ncbi:hypothetical protein NSE_0022 [Neorickettsia sennetsu str. Miyayama]|uniref:Uncharacterized protein n=1 Tax=Ehrlichia sennetsu (strain ATCC VR-367 / Miyayama) TaxID=222891 RepID=Q2GF31_EHRS3|nr:hypothetical protein NSE_0022 [Neorickettsia sennetsu str. Miyayama]
MIPGCCCSTLPSFVVLLGGSFCLCCRCGVGKKNSLCVLHHVREGYVVVDGY